MSGSRPRASVSWRATLRRWFIPLLLTSILLTLDQMSKGWVLQELGPEPGSREIALIGDWFSLVYVQNTGVAFGLFQNFTQFFTIIALIISAGAVYAYLFYLPNASTWVQVSIGLIIGGALGNVIDRIRLSYVIDFIRVGWWPVFNVADSSITTGVVLLALYLLFAEEERPPLPMPSDDHLLTELLSQDVAVNSEPGARMRPGITDSGRRHSENE